MEISYRGGMGFQGQLNGIDAVFKMVDIDKDNRKVKSLLKEALSYHTLQDLQGCIIPRLLLWQLEFGLAIIATEFKEGVPYRKSEDPEREYLKKAKFGLAEIHRHRRLHGDPVVCNLVMDKKEERIWWIDLGRSAPCSSNESFEEEIEVLRNDALEEIPYKETFVATPI